MLAICRSMRGRVIIEPCLILPSIDLHAAKRAIRLPPKPTASLRKQRNSMLCRTSRALERRAVLVLHLVLVERDLIPSAAVLFRSKALKPAQRHEASIKSSGRGG